MKFKLISVEGGIHLTKSVNERPTIRLQAWRVLAVEGLSHSTHGVTHHFVGYDIDGGEGRASTAVQVFDPATRKGRTESGRTYELLGKPGRDMDAQYVWNRWKKLNGTGPETDVTERYLPVVPFPSRPLK